MVVGPSNRSRNDPVVHGVSRAASVVAGVAVPWASKAVATSRSSGAGRRQRCRVVGDPGGGVGGGDGLVQGGPFHRAAAAVPISTATRVCRNSARRVRASGRRSPAGMSSGLSRTPDTPSWMVMPADRVGEADVLVFGVDDRDVHAVGQGAQDLQFDEVGLAGAGAGQDDAVVVVLRPPVPPHDPVGVGVEPVQHAARVACLPRQRCRQVGARRAGTRRRSRRCP